MNSLTTTSRLHWKRIALSRQGLTSVSSFGKGLVGVRRAIEHLGYVQIDTLSVVERAHHHILWSRVPGYKPGHLNQLLREGHVFEHWFHAAAYLPMRDYRFALPRMNGIRRGENRYFVDVDEQLMREIMARVRGEGSLRVRDIDTGRGGGTGSWWNRGPGKRALDKLFMQGDLMVCERNGMEKVYDLAERILPPNLDLREPSVHEYATYLLDCTVRAHGLVTWKQVLHLKTGEPLKNAMREILAERIASDQLVEVHDAGLRDAYADVAMLQRPAKAMPDAVKLLSPFDNLVIHRERLAALFGIDYRLECYVPAPKRQFGYFCLPILQGERIVGRVDCKAHRADRRLALLSLHVEDRTADHNALMPKLVDALRAFAAFNGCESIDAPMLSLVEPVTR